MRLRLLFVDYSSEDPGTMPNAVAVTDEFMEDTWGELPDFYVEARKGTQERSEDSPVREMFVTIPDDAVLALFAPPVVAGTVSRGE